MDASVFLQEQVLLHRLARTRYANLTGIGAAKDGAHWNRKGQEAIYTSLEAACTVLERLVHTSKKSVPQNMSLMQIFLRGKWNKVGNVFTDEITEAKLVVCPTISEADGYHNTRSVEVDSPFALAVPSVIVPAWNVVLYPENKGFWKHVSLGMINAYQYDLRLFPEDAVSEDGV